MPMQRKPVEKRYGRLEVIEAAPGGWRCRCDCGNEVVASGTHLRSGATQSCGCLNSANRRARKYRHGKSRTRIHNIWSSMRQRCEDANHSNFANYGAKGIRVCDRWQTFENFLADMGDPPEGASIDRTDSLGNYEPGNCRWATRTEQTRNRSVARSITIGGVSKSLAEWCAEKGINYHTAYGRLQKGWPVERVFAQ